MTEPAVAVNGVTKVFPLPFQRRSIVAVRDLNLRVALGQIYGLLGPNGSGKSTTLKIILGLVPPTKGSTAIFGRDSNLVASREAVGFLPENPYFYKYTVLLSSHLLEQVQEICDRVGILANGVLVREGALDDLLAIENRTEFVLENASAALVNEVEALAAESGARLIERGRPRTSLERLFLEATEAPKKTERKDS